MRIEPSDAGLAVTTTAYRLEVDRTGRYATLRDPDGELWASLLLDGSLHTTAGLDETVRRGAPRVRTWDGGWSVRVELESATWRRKTVRLDGDDAAIRFAIEVEGEGSLTDVDLLGAWSSAEPGAGTGFHASRAGFASVLSPGPSDPAKLVRSAGEPATLDVSAGSGPGRGNWFFTPPPLCLLAARAPVAAHSVGAAPIPAGPWLFIGVACRLEDATFGAVRYEPGERSFSLRLEYEGQTLVDGTFVTPELVLRLGATDPYAAIAEWATDLRGRGLAPRSDEGAPAAWWQEPIFCGWGSQSALARSNGGQAADYATQAAYDGFLGALEAEGVVPGTVVIDDRWQRTYGLGEPDVERWPDLRGWIEARHARDQRVLLWWKCWDAAGVDAALCITNGAGVAVAVDPSNPAYEALLRAQVRAMLGDLGADGLKVDFSGLTPSGPSLRRHGSAWGISLLHRLLAIIHDESHRTKPDALVITHTPHPWFADVTDMLRLNDMLRLGEAADDRSTVVDQMRHRAAIVSAAMPGIPIDTDDWCAPDVATWRRYLALKPELGVPSLYYATSLDLTDERLAPDDYAAIREVWARWRARHGLPRRAGATRAPVPA
jgi:hypothetical protein